MGDRTGTPDVVGLLFFFHSFSFLFLRFTFPFTRIPAIRFDLTNTFLCFRCFYPAFCRYFARFAVEHAFCSLRVNETNTTSSPNTTALCSHISTRSRHRRESSLPSVIAFTLTLSTYANATQHNTAHRIATQCNMTQRIAADCNGSHQTCCSAKDHVDANLTVCKRNTIAPKQTKEPQMHIKIKHDNTRDKSNESNQSHELIKTANHK